MVVRIVLAWSFDGLCLFQFQREVGRGERERERERIQKTKKTKILVGNLRKRRPTSSKVWLKRDQSILFNYPQRLSFTSGTRDRSDGGTLGLCILFFVLFCLVGWLVFCLFVCLVVFFFYSFLTVNGKIRSREELVSKFLFM